MNVGDQKGIDIVAPETIIPTNQPIMISLLDAATRGIGVYSISEASRYAKMHQATLRNWFYGTATRDPLHRSGIQSDDFKAVTFLDFVEAVAIRSLRVDYRVSFQKIREALKNAKDQFDIDHPFAHKDHRTTLIGNDLHIFLSEDKENPVQLTGKGVGQKSLKSCIESYMQDLSFDENGLANLYHAYEFKGQRVVLNPKIHFGTPVLEENGYTAETLYRAVLAEGSIERAAELYEVTPSSVEAAYRYYNSELGLAA